MTSQTPLAMSALLKDRAKKVIPGWTQTLSKNPTQWVQGVAPAYVSKAKGAYVWDVDGNRYIDLPLALGAVILGHGNENVNSAIIKQLESGIAYTLAHPIELEVAERIIDRVPGVERVRFAKNGSDVTSAAIRLARAVTGRSKVLACGYHGWHDWYIGTTSRRKGVPAVVAELTETFQFNDLQSLRASLEEQAGETAAIILEPTGAERPQRGFLEGVIEIGHQFGAVVIFDEVVSGFRVAPGGAQERYGVCADLTAFGKALGNGMPISALAGSAELMDQLEDVFFSGTHGGETLSLAAARATLDALDSSAYEKIGRLGERLRQEIEASIEKYDLTNWVVIGGEACRTVVQIHEPEGSKDSLLAKSFVQQELARLGLLFNGNNFISTAHSEEDIDYIAFAYDKVFAQLASALPNDLSKLLDGEPVAPAFRPV